MSKDKWFLIGALFGIFGMAITLTLIGGCS